MAKLNSHLQESRDTCIQALTWRFKRGILAENELQSGSMREAIVIKRLECSMRPWHLEPRFELNGKEL